jgi:uncharacterized repeat protein (TIGR01451 family)
MWNGIWKLTVMVGVIGVGLFAVYQAQQGMSRVATSTASDTDAAENIENSKEFAGSPDGPGVGLPVVSTDQFDGVRPLSKRPRPSSTLNKNRIELVGNFEPEAANIQTAVGSNSEESASVQREPRRLGFSLREEDTPAEDESSNPFAEETTEKNTQPIRQASESSIESENRTPESNDDPFADAVIPMPAVETPVTTEQQTTEQQAPPRTLDFASEADIPRSRRAMAREKKAELNADEERNPFDDEAEKAKSPSLKLPDSIPTEGSGDADLPEPGESAPRETSSSNDSTPPISRGTLPAEPSVISTDGVEPLGKSPSKNRPALPADLGGESDDTPPVRSPATKKRHGEIDPPTTMDLSGDGVVGDASQQGLQQPRLTIEKIAQQQAVLDQPLIYTIIVKNTGSVIAHNVVIEDRIPKGTELLGTSPRAELSGKRLIWNEPALKPNEEKKISIKVVPKQEGPIGSVARVYFATEVSAEIQVAIPQLEFTVKAPQEVRLGQTFDMVFNLKNVGTVDASNISVRDIIPAHLKHEAGTDIECPIGKLAPNEVREIVLPVTATATGSGSNRAFLTADSGIKKEIESTISVVGELLVLTRSGQNRVYVERPVVFTNNVRNDGNLRVANVRVAEVVPAGMKFETASDGGKYDSKLKAVVWTLGPLAPGDDKAVTVKYVPEETGTHRGKITATGATGSTASVNATVDVVGRPELQMETLSATGVVTVGDRITSKLQLKNTGTAPARHVQLSIRLPTELRLVEVRGRKFHQKGDTVIFDSIDELAPRKNVAFELILEPTSEADARIQLEISAEHLTKPHRRDETIQIVQDALK